LRRGLDFVDAEQPANRPCPTFGNGDLSPMNFICGDDGRITVVDWEYAGFADPIAEIMLLHTWPEDAPFLQSHPIDRIYCEMNGIPAALLKWYEVCSAISGWIYAANDDNRRRLKLHGDHLDRCLN
jgi:aminoglycoside phosphotransferase (APT) family kinase protein